MHASTSCSHPILPSPQRVTRIQRPRLELASKRSFARALSLDIDFAVVESDLTLVLAFQGGASLEVRPDPHYEAWQVTGPASRLIVWPPGGGNLAVWC